MQRCNKEETFPEQQTSKTSVPEIFMLPLTGSGPVIAHLVPYQ